MREATYEAAVVLLDDLQYIRETFAKANPTTGDVRRISGVLRRLLLDGHLSAVAAPRAGRLMLQIPDNLLLFVNNPAPLIVVGFAPIFQMGVPFCEFVSVSDPIIGAAGSTNLQLGKADHPTREVNIDGMLSDRIARWNGQFVTRADVLKYICYHAFGIHFSGKEDPAFDIIRHFRYILTFKRRGGNALEVVVSDPGRELPGALMDYAHALTFSLGSYLVESQSVVALETLIEAEVASI